MTPLQNTVVGKHGYRFSFQKWKLKEIKRVPCGSRQWFSQSLPWLWDLQLPWLCFWPHAGTRWSCQSSHVSPHRPSDTVGALHLLPNPPQPAHFQTRKPQLRTRSLAFPRLHVAGTGLWCGSVDLSASLQGQFPCRPPSHCPFWMLVWGDRTPFLYRAFLGSACTKCAQTAPTTYVLSGFHDSSWILLTSFATQWSLAFLSVALEWCQALSQWGSGSKLFFKRLPALICV